MAKAITPKTPSRTETRRTTKAGMGESMVTVAAITGKAEDRKAARPAAMQGVRKLLLGHFSGNAEKFNEGVVVFRAITGTEAAEWDSVTYAACRAANTGAAGAVALEGFLRDPVGALDRSLMENIAVLEQIPTMFQTSKTDPRKARERREKLLLKDWTKVRHACTSIADVMDADFSRAREYLARQHAVAEPVAEPEPMAEPVAEPVAVAVAVAVAEPVAVAVAELVAKPAKRAKRVKA